MSTKKPAVEKPETSPSEPEKQQPQETKPAEPPPEATQPQSEPIPPQPEKPKPLTLSSLSQELQSLRHLVNEHADLMTRLQEVLIRKRKPVASNGKVQIRDKETGTVYRSKNNAYQTLLKSGALKELADKGVFGDIPAKNTFGWYTLVREWPDRFEEVPPEEKQS